MLLALALMGLICEMVENAYDGLDDWFYGKFLPDLENEINALGRKENL